MTLDELIAIVKYKKENIKAHICPYTFQILEETLLDYKKIKDAENVDSDSHI